MARVDNLFADYHGVIDHGYPEVALSYSLAQYHRKRHEFGRYLELMCIREPGMWASVWKKGMENVLREYADKVLMGEKKEAIEESVRKISSADFRFPFPVRLLASRNDDVKRMVSSEIDREVIGLFRRAKEKGLTTGIYTNGITDVLEPHLENIGIKSLFDHIIGNKLDYDDKESRVSDLKVNILKEKSSFKRDIEKLGLDIERTACIDNRDIMSLHQAGVGIASPSADEDFKNFCEALGIPTPESWAEVGEMLEI
jgi:FMN phosphatase YigB (HAD superfamily)